MNRKLAIPIVAGLLIIVVLSLFVALNWSSNQTVTREFYVGVEFAYGDHAAEVKALVDKVKDYTNLMVLGSVGLSFNRTALEEACDYIFDAKLHFIILFTSSNMYSYDIFDWITDAKLKYGEQLLGIYRYDEPGGHQLDRGREMLIENGSSYTEVAQSYVGNLSIIINYYLDYAPKIFTSDYGLYWFDYKANYTTVFAEFVGNASRQHHIALCRGAAEAFGKDWGAIITWKYNQAPYLESGDELYDDLALAYSAGAKYSIVFSYPTIGAYGTLTEEHFSALQRFWDTLHSNPDSFGSNKPEAAYVLPADYGFSFRNNDGTVIWGLFPADELSAKIYNDAETLTAQYGAKLNIFYDEPQTAALLENYKKVFYWNQTIP